MLKKFIYQRIVLAILLIIAAIPGLVLSYHSVQEPWTLFRMARAIDSLNKGYLVEYNTTSSVFYKERLGVDFLQTLFLDLTNLASEWVAILPIGSLILVTMYFIVSLRFSGSRIIAVATAMYAGWYYPRLVSQYGIQTYVWTNTLFLGFILIFYDWIQEKKPMNSLALILIYVITFLFYQTTPVWIIISVLTATLLKNIRQKDLLREWALPFFCLVIYLSFDSIFYNNFLYRFTSERTDNALLQSFLGKISAPLTGQISELGPYRVASLNPRLAIWMNLLCLTLMTLPVGFWMVLKLFEAYKAKNIIHLIKKDEDIYLWSIIVVTIVHTIGYGGYGAISIRLIPLVFPILWLFIQRSLKLSPNFTLIAFISLAIASIVGFLSYASGLRSEPNEEDLGISTILLENKSYITADGSIFGLLLVKGAKEGKIFDFYWPEPKEYAALAENGEPFSDYMALDKYGNPVVTYGWGLLEPWIDNLDKIEENRNISKIYDSDFLTIFQQAHYPLPYKTVEREMIDINQIDFNKRYLQTVGIFLFLLLVPGGLLTFLVIDRFSNIAQPFFIICFSIILGISLIILSGYFIYLFSLSINLLLPLIILETILLCLAVFFLRKNRKLHISLGLDLFLAILLFSLWAYMSTIVAEERNVSRKYFTEVFITQQSLDNYPVLNIFNRSDQTKIYQITLFKNDRRIELSKYQVQEYHLFQLGINLPREFDNQRIIIKVQEMGKKDNFRLIFFYNINRN